jgi:hypothetical protein
MRYWEDVRKWVLESGRAASYAVTDRTEGGMAFSERYQSFPGTF